MAASPVPVDRGDTQVREKWLGKEERPGDSLAHGADLPPSNGGPPDERGASDPVSAEYHPRNPSAGVPGPGTRSSGATIYREKHIRPNKVYISGLPENTRREVLQSCFGKIGGIVNIELKVGYGFVEFDSREAAEESVAKYNEGFFMGNKIRVEISHGVGRFAKFSGDPGACFKCGQMGHWARECPNHVVRTLKSTLPEQAEANAVEAAMRTGPERRKYGDVDDRRPIQTSLVKQRDADPVDMQARLRDMQAKLDELVLSRDQQIGKYENELENMRAKLEANVSELEAVRLRLSDAEKGLSRLTKRKAEVDTLCAPTKAGSVNKDEDQVTRGLMERVRVIEAEMASRRWNEKSIEEMECRNEG